MSEQQTTPNPAPASTPSVAFSEYPKGAFAGFYNPILGIRDLSTKLSTSSAVIFSGACALILYVLSVLLFLGSYIFKDYEPNVLNIALNAFITYACMTFGIAGLAWVVSRIQNLNRKFSEIVSAVTMAIIPGSLLIIWGQGLSFISYVPSFFYYVGRAYIAILLFEHLKDDRLTGKKQFFTAAIVAALGIAISYIIF